MEKIKENWKIIVIILAVIFAVLLEGVFLVQGAQNKAIGLEEQVNAAMSDINIQEKRRVDLVYNLADCAKAYSDHEANTLIAIAEGRSGAGSIENVQTVLSAVVEAYPEMKSDALYKELMNELSITENLIAQTRSNYTKQVRAYNRYIHSFPARVFLAIAGYDGEELEYLDYGATSDAPQNLFG